MVVPQRPGVVGTAVLVHEPQSDLFRAGSLDDKVGCLAMLEAMRSLRKAGGQLHATAVFVAAVQEEVGLRGAKQAGNRLRPDACIGIDATAGVSNQVTIDLAGQAVDKIMADLGGGDNSLIVQGGTVHGNLIFTGGTGRFAGATGSVTFVISDVVITVDPVAGTMTITNQATMEGTITY